MAGTQTRTNSYLTYPSGKVLDVSYGSDGNPNSLTFDGQELASNIGWTASGQPQGWEWTLAGLPAGKSYVSITRDDNGLPNGYEDVANRQIVRDNDRRVVAIDDILDVSKTQLFDWDGSNRLTLGDVGGWASPLGYGWNANNNLTDKTDIAVNSGVGWSYNSNSNRLNTTFSVVSGIPSTGTALAHDPIGNLAGDAAGRSFGYDAMNRLAKTTSGSLITQYGYAGMVRRIDDNGSVVKLYEVDESGRRLGEYVKDASQPNGIRPVQEFVYLDGWRIVGLVDYASGGGNTLMAVLSDPMTGTPRQVMDGSGDVRWDWDAKEAFGLMSPAKLKSLAFSFHFVACTISLQKTSIASYGKRWVRQNTPSPGDRAFRRAPQSCAPNP